ncbi:hypothetical protein FIBSPDRAFT_872964 [Athelia psychrophila]|uniref:Uncharacterized protein n=1 Tax=Athelia psychrophila TaxID=1759441 RepID=A0A165Z0E8_9AGAM|nr:hypothetical protein FIBSPDRAFT_872964 [Fibularhizoctonia sp. CBS 109695]
MDAYPSPAVSTLQVPFSTTISSFSPVTPADNTRRVIRTKQRTLIRSWRVPAMSQTQPLAAICVSPIPTPSPRGYPEGSAYMGANANTTGYTTEAIAWSWGEIGTGLYFLAATLLGFLGPSHFNPHLSMLPSYLA